MGGFITSLEAWKKIAEDREAALAAANAENARLREALKPFSDAVYNDNGEMTVTHVGIDPYIRAYLIMRRSLAAGQHETGEISMSYFDTDIKIDPKTIARIKPCPFCGNAPETFASGERSRGLMIHCISENCPNPSVSYCDHETALAVWNQRDGGRQR